MDVGLGLQVIEEGAAPPGDVRVVLADHEATSVDHDADQDAGPGPLDQRGGDLSACLVVAPAEDHEIDPASGGGDQVHQRAIGRLAVIKRR